MRVCVCVCVEQDANGSEPTGRMLMGVNLLAALSGVVVGPRPTCLVLCLVPPFACSTRALNPKPEARITLAPLDSKPTTPNPKPLTLKPKP